MRSNEASRTAEYMALFRALETTRPATRRLFVDPLAENFLGPRLRRVAQAARIPGAGALVRWRIDQRWPGTRTSAIARTRFIDDAVGQALAGGVEQVVILGAGFDCRAHRLPGMERAQVFEVDHPDTGRAKRATIERLGVSAEHVRYVAIDFNRQNLEERLLAAGFTRERSTLFIWEGVTNYLTAEAVDATLRALRRLTELGQLIFTYVDRAVLERPDAYPGTTALREALTEAGEQWTFGLAPPELANFLAERGFQLVENIGSVDYRLRYLPRRTRFLRGYEFYRIARCAAHAAR